MCICKTQILVSAALCIYRSSNIIDKREYTEHSKYRRALPHSWAMCENCHRRWFCHCAGVECVLLQPKMLVMSWGDTISGDSSLTPMDDCYSHRPPERNLGCWHEGRGFSLPVIFWGIRSKCGKILALAQSLSGLQEYFLSHFLFCMPSFLSLSLYLLSIY